MLITSLQHFYDLNYRWREAKENILKRAQENKSYYDAKLKKPNEIKIGDNVRIRQPQTRTGLKKKLRNDNFSEFARVTNILPHQNIEVVIKNKKKNKFKKYKKS